MWKSLVTADCKSNKQAEQWKAAVDLPPMYLIIFPTSACPFAIVVPQSAKCWSQTQCKFTRPPSMWKGLVPRLLSAMLPTSYPGHVGGEKRPCIDCLNVCDNSQKNLGIRLRLEIEYIFLPWRYMYSCLLTFNSKAKMLSCGYQLVSVSWYATRCCHLRVLSVNKASWVQGGVDTLLSC